MVRKKIVNGKDSISVGVIGCGWLGRALVKQCVAESTPVVATTQTREKLPDINALGASSHILTLPLSENGTDKMSVFDCYALIICIPPKIRQGRRDYADKIAQLVAYAEVRAVKKIILISTTAIYDGIVGDVDETSPLKTALDKVAILSKAESAALAFSKSAIVLRCAGLVGPERHPSRFFSATRLLKEPNAYVNLVHQYDVVMQVMAFVHGKIENGIYNCVSDMQVTKKHFYEVAAQAVGKQSPEFDKLSELDLGKRVIAEKIRRILGYQYQFDDLITWVANHNE